MVDGQARERNRRRRTAVPDLPAIQEHAVGGDLGSREHWACCLPGQTGAAQLRAFGTTTPVANPARAPIALTLVVARRQASPGCQVLGTRE